MMKMLILFFIVNLVNVIMSTAKSLVTVNGGRMSATLVNAITFGFYTYVVILIADATVNIHIKALLVTLANLVGVFIVKTLEMKLHKDRLWVFNATVKEKSDTINELVRALKDMNIKLIYTEVVPNALYSLQVFSNTQKESTMIKSVFENYNLKFYVTESKNN